MGKVVKAVVGIVATVVGVVTGQWWLVAAGVALTMSSVMAVKPTTNAATEQRLSKKLEPETFRKIVFGETAAGADLRYWEVFGTDANRYLEVIAAATHKVHSFGQLSINELPASYAHMTRSTYVEGVSGAGSPRGGHGKWTATSAMTGCAYYILDYTYKQEWFPQGISSRYTQVIQGALLYDPRRDIRFGGTHNINDQTTWQYSPLDSNGVPIGRNNALQMLWYQIGWRINNKLVAGKGVDVNDIDLDSFIQAANDCELMGWYSDCILSTGDSHDTNEGILEAASQGHLLDTGGRFSYYVSVDDTANIAVAFDNNDIIGEGFDWQPRDPMSTFFNEVAGTFVDPAALYQPRPYPMVFDNAYYAADGKKERETVALGAVQDPAQAQKLMRIKLNRSRFQGEFSATFNYKAMRAQNYSIVTLAMPELGWTTPRLFRVVSYGIAAMGGIDLTLREESASIYAGGSVTTLPAPSTGVGTNPFMELSTGAITTEAVTEVGSAGSAIDGVKLSYAAFPPLTARAELKYRKTGDTVWAEVPVDRNSTETIVKPLQPGTSYEFSMRLLSIYGIDGPATVVSQTTGTTTVAPDVAPLVPGDVAGTPSISITSTIMPDGTQTSRLFGAWTAPANALTYIVELDNSTIVQQLPVTENALENVIVPTGPSYRYRVRAVSRTGTPSAAWSAWSAYAGASGDTTAPGPVTGGAVTPYARRILVSWSPPTDDDFSHVILYRDTTGTLAAPDTYIVTGSAYPDTAVNAGTLYYYWTRTVDRTGNVQAGYTYIGSATPTYVSVGGGDVLFGDPFLHTDYGTSAAYFGQTPWGTYTARTTANLTAAIDTSGYLTSGLNARVTPREMMGGIDGSNLASNPEFAGNTLDSIGVYNNAGGNKVTHALQYDQNAPNNSRYILKISYDGTGTPDANPAPGFGGLFQLLKYTTGAARAGYYTLNSRILYKVWASIPVGRDLGWAGNAMGVGATITALTSMAGTGDWQLYIWEIFTGYGGGTPSNIGHLYCHGGANVAFDWYVAKYDQIDTTGPATTYINTGLRDSSGVRRGDIDLITIQGTAAAITGQTAWATLGTSTGRLTYLNDSGELSDLTRVVSRPMTALTGRTADNISYVGGGGVTMETLRPAEAGANVTETRVAASVTGQTDWATSTVPVSHLTRPGANLIFNGSFSLGLQGTYSAGGAHSVVNTAYGPSLAMGGHTYMSEIVSFPSNVGGSSFVMSVEGIRDTDLAIYVVFYDDALGYLGEGGYFACPTVNGERTSSAAVTATAGTRKLRVYAFRPNAGNVSLRKLKIEFGTVATPWSDEATNGAIYRDGVNVDQLRPGEIGANVTEGRVAASVTGQTAWATLGTSTGRLTYLNDSGELSDLTRVISRPMTALTGRTADNLTYVAGGATVESLRPGEAGANITESRTASAITGQTAWATYGTLTPNAVADRTQYLQGDGNLLATYVYYPSNVGGGLVSNLRPGEAGANVTETRTASAITGQTAAATAPDLKVFNDRKQGNVVHVQLPVGGSNENSDWGNVGAWRIVLPQGWTSTMISFDVHVQEYGSRGTVIYSVYGYAHGVGDLWTNSNVKATGDRIGFKPVYMHKDPATGRPAVDIGLVNSSDWHYSKISVQNVRTGHTPLDVGNWESGWTVTLTNAARGATDYSISASAIGQDAIFGENSYEDGSKAVICTLPNFKTSQGVAATVSGQTAWATSAIPVARVQYLNDSGRIISGLGLPINAGSGLATTLSPLLPLSAGSPNSTVITVAASTATLAGGTTLSLPSASITGLTADTSYAVFRDTLNSVYVTVTSGASSYFTSADRYLFIGAQRTALTDGAYSPPPPPPDGSEPPWMCVSEDTLVLMADRSTKPAGDLVEGDRLYTVNEHTLEWGEYGVTRVTDAIEHCTRVLLSDGDELVVTPDHRVYVQDYGFVHAKDLRHGALLAGVEPKAVHGQEYAGKRRVMKITVAGAGTYVSAGVLSHNIKY